jgi:uroporphyrinogen III methyltransferase/synthase
VAALQAVDGRLARIDRPQLVNLRRAIARDLERLRAAPAVDVTGLAVKLDQMINAVDGLALVAEPVRQPTKATEGKAADAKAAEDKGMEAKGAGWWIRTRAWLRDEFGDLVRIRQVDTPEALLLNEQQQRLARQQLRLRLLNARQSLLQRNDRLYRADLAEAQTLLARYYDGKQPNVQAAAAQLKAMAQAPLSVEVPQITDSLAALQGARSARGSR